MYEKIQGIVHQVTGQNDNRSTQDWKAFVENTEHESRFLKWKLEVTSKVKKHEVAI